MTAGLETLAVLPDLKQENKSIGQKLAQSKGLTLKLWATQRK